MGSFVSKFMLISACGLCAALGIGNAKLRVTQAKTRLRSFFHNAGKSAVGKLEENMSYQ